jgi:hypothetical protein
MAFNVAALPAYTDQLSMDLISKAVLNTDLLSYVDLRPGFSSGSVSINLVETSTPLTIAGCNGYPTAGNDVTYSQVDVVVASLQSKSILCVEDLRSKYLSAFMSPGMGNDVIPFEEVISESYVKSLRKENENFLINGNVAAGATGLKAQITSANGAGLQAGVPAAWTATNAIDQALDLYEAIDESVIDRDDIIMVVSPVAYRALTRALVAQGSTGLYHYKSVEGNDILMLPGTNATVVKSSGLVGSDNKFAGPAGMILAATGLTDELDNFRFFYDESNDEMKFRASYRLGVGVSQVAVFATNDMA